MPNKAKFEVPTLGPNVTPEMIVEELGRLSAIRSYEKKMTKFYQEAFYARVNGKEAAQQHGPYEGDNWRAVVSSHERTAFNQSLHAQEKPECHAEYVMPSTVFTMRMEHKTDIEFNSMVDSLRKELELD